MGPGTAPTVADGALEHQQELEDCVGGGVVRVQREVLKYLTHYVPWYGPLYLATPSWSMIMDHPSRHFPLSKRGKRVSDVVALPCLVQSKSGPQVALRFCGEHVLALEGEYDRESTTTDGVRQA